MNISSLTPSDIERLWREHSRMLEALKDIAYELPRLDSIQRARDVVTEIAENAVQDR